MRTRTLWQMALPIAIIFGASCQKDLSFKNSTEDLNQSTVLQTSSLAEDGCTVIKNLKGIGETSTYGTFQVKDLGENLEVTITAKTGFYLLSTDVVWGNIDDVNSLTAAWDPCGEIVGMYDNSFDFGEAATTVSFTIPGADLTDGCVWIAANVQVSSNVSTIRCTFPYPNAGQGDEWKGAFEFCRCLPPPPPPPQDCGQLRTQTPGGWGAPPAGNNPGTYLHANFDEVFPSGLSIGSFPDYHVSFENAWAITNYLPAGGQAKKLTQNYLNPSTSSLKNTLVNHLLALTLSVRFDAADASFGTAGMPLGNMEIGSGAFAGMTVNQFLVIANGVLGGTNNIYSVQDVLTTASAINENYTDGLIDNHYLVCPND